MNTLNKAGAAGQAAASPDALAAPLPADLLPQLATWLTAAGHDAAHPWQLAIARSLAAHAQAQELARREDSPVQAVCDTIARTAEDVLELIDVQDAMPHRAPLRAAVAQMGWLADELVARVGGHYVKGDAATWLVESYGRDALQALGGKA